MPPEQAVKEDDESVPGKGIGVGVEGKDKTNRAPEGQYDRGQAGNHHQFADETKGHEALGDGVSSRKGSLFFFR